MLRPTRMLVFALLAILVLAAAAPTSARPGAQDRTSSALIREAYRTGSIGKADMVLLSAYSLYAPSRLPEQYRGSAIDKCGTPVVLEIDEALPELPVEVADEIRGLRARPTNTAYYDTEHFRIHYDTSGTKKILGWPDTSYLDAIAAAAENCWATEVDSWGFRPPPSDGGDPDGGDGGPLYDIYVQDCSGYYGYCQGVYTQPGAPTNDCSSYVVIDNDYAGFGYPDPTDPMKVTVAHEFNHACQMAHDYTEGIWYMECTAVWAEDRVYDSINDYVYYLPYFYNSLYQSLEWEDGTGLRVYGSAAWNIFLGEHVSQDVIPDIWYECENPVSTYTAMQYAMTAHGTSLEDEFNEFAIWNWFTGSRDDGMHYEEGSTWPLATLTATYSSYPIVDGAPYSNYLPDHMGANYIKFTNPGEDYVSLLVGYDGPMLDTKPNRAYLNWKTSTPVGSGEYGEIPLNPWGVGSLTVDEWHTYSNLTLVVTNPNTSGDDMSYTYDVEQVNAGVPPEGDEVFAMSDASPNPFRSGTSLSYNVPSGGGRVTMSVYDVRGRLVRSLLDEELPAGAAVAHWDGLDSTGRPVASGIYFVRLDVDDLTAWGKLVAIR